MSFSAELGVFFFCSERPCHYFKTTFLFTRHSHYVLLHTLHVAVVNSRFGEFSCEFDSSPMALIIGHCVLLALQ